MPGTLYVVATPIGNMEDITFRAVRRLRDVDVIACEDTRVTGKILKRYELPHKPLISLHQHSGARSFQKILDLLREGKNIAYVSDAGTPNVNDPGGKLVETAYAEGITVVPIPGPSALTAAISCCGFPMERFTYLGFLPHKKGRAALIKEIIERDDATVFLESTHRIQKTISELVNILPADRLIYVGRELTKKFETNLRGSVSDIQVALEKGSAKGEFIVIIAPT